MNGGKSIIDILRLNERTDSFSFFRSSKNGLYNFVNDAFSASSSLLIFRFNTRTSENEQTHRKHKHRNQDRKEEKAHTGMRILI